MNIIKNNVGESTPSYITPVPMYKSLSLTLKAVYLYSHSIVFTKGSLILSYLIFLNSISWLTMSNADFRSIKRVQSFLFCESLSFSLIVSVILSIFSSQPIPYLKHVWLLLSFHLPLWFSSSRSLLFRIVSNNLYIGEVLVIGLALKKHFHGLSSFAIYSYSNRFYLKGSYFCVFKQ